MAASSWRATLTVKAARGVAFVWKSLKRSTKSPRVEEGGVGDPDRGVLALTKAVVVVDQGSKVQPPCAEMPTMQAPGWMIGDVRSFLSFVVILLLE